MSDELVARGDRIHLDILIIDNLVGVVIVEQTDWELSIVLKSPSYLSQRVKETSLLQWSGFPPWKYGL